MKRPIKQFVYIVAFLLIPSLCGATWSYVVGPSGYYYRTDGVHNDGWLYSRIRWRDCHGWHVRYERYQQIGGAAQPSGYGAGYASDSVQKSLVTLAREKFEWQTIQETIGQLFPRSAAPGYAGGPSATTYAAPQLGSTVYGATVQTVSATNSKPFDLEAQMERLSRMFAQAQDAAKPIADGVVDATAQQIAGQNVALQTMAQTLREQALLQSIQPIAPQETKVESSYQATERSATGDQPAAPVAAATVSGSVSPSGNWKAKFAAVVATRCATCHQGDAPPNGLDLSVGVDTLELATLTKLRQAVTAGRMPLNAAHEPVPLASDEQNLFCRAELEAK